MNTKYIGFPAILPDNEYTYFRYVEGSIGSVDHAASVQFTNMLHAVNIRIAPSRPILIDGIIESLQDIHNRLSLKMEYSKSMKTSAVISFNISLENN